jgi:hypothetical protein
MSNHLRAGLSYYYCLELFVISSILCKFLRDGHMIGSTYLVV